MQLAEAVSIFIVLFGLWILFLVLFRPFKYLSISSIRKRLNGKKKYKLVCPKHAKTLPFGELALIAVPCDYCNNKIDK